MPSGPTIEPGSPRELRRYEALLEMADLMVHHRSLPELFHELAQRLQKVVDFQLLNFSLYNPERNAMDMHLWEGELAPEIRCDHSLQESASGWVWEHQEPLLFEDLAQESRFPLVMDMFRERGYRTYYVMPLTTAQKRLGALGVASHRPGAYRAADESLLLRIAELVALAVENAVTRDALREEKERLQALVDVNRTLVSSLEMQRLLPLISECVTRVVPHDFAGVTLYEGDKQAMKAYVLSPADNRSILETGRTVSLEQTLSADAFLEQKPITLTREDLHVSRTAIAGRVLEVGIQTVLCMPLLTSKGAVGTLNVGSRKDDAFSEQDQELLNQVAAQLAIALDNARAYREIAALKDRLAEERLYLQDEIRTELNFEEIIGESMPLKRVLAQAKTVAPSGSTALDPGRNRHGQGTDRAGHSPHEPPARRQLHQDQLRGHSDRIARKRTLWPREGRFHRGGQSEGGAHGTRRQRHAFSR